MILDSTALIDLVRGKQEAIEKIAELTQEGIPVSTTLLSVFELFSGLVHAQKPQEEIERIRNILRAITKWPVTEASAERAGKIHGSLRNQGRTVEAVDCMIAAIALERNEPLLTDNTDHFSRIPGVDVEHY